MDNVHVALVKELMHHLCVHLDLHCTDEQLMDSSNDEIRTMQEATALLLVAGSEPPDIYAHLMQRLTTAERRAAGSPSSESTADEE